MAFIVETGQDKQATSEGAVAISWENVLFLMDKWDSVGMLIGMFVQENENSSNIDLMSVNKMLAMFASNC